jgi:transposase InsO family protein
VHDTDSAEHAAHLAKRTAFAEGIQAMPMRPVLHGDNGVTLKATTVLAMLYWLGIPPSYSRPRVSDDNAFVEAVFRTAKYRPTFPSKGFDDLAITCLSAPTPRVLLASPLIEHVARCKQLAVTTDAARQWAMRFVQV